MGEFVALNGKHLYISSCGGVGDLIMFTPALRKIKENYPGVKITFLTAKHNKDSIDGLPFLEKVIWIERKKKFGRWRALWQLKKQDAVVFTDWQPQLLVAAWLLRISVRCGIPKPGHFLNRLLTKELQNHVMKSAAYAVQTNARIFEEALEIDLSGEFGEPEMASPSLQDKERVDTLLAEAGLMPDATFICLTPFAGLEERNWPLEAAREWIGRTERKYKVPVIILGPESKRQEAKTLGGINLTGKTTLLQLVEVIRRAALHVGPDSGPMHIAGAVGTPTVALFSKDLPSRWAPRQNCQVVTLALPCSPCSDEAARSCESLQCMRGLTADMVEEAVECLWNACQRHETIEKPRKDELC